jgi:hypothetical protein
MNDPVNETGLRTVVVFGVVAAVLIGGAMMIPKAETPAPALAPGVGSVTPVTPATVATVSDKVLKAQPLAPFAEKGLGWLAEAQHTNGGWGGGSSANQQLRDPHAVVTDPGTTAFAAMAFLRAGHTPTAGKYKDVVSKSLEHLLGVVESAPEDGPKITDVTGTQPQAKMGQFVDTALVSQFLSRVLPEVKGDAKLEARVSKAVDKCVRKIQKSQGQDGNWAAGGWAPVLQSSLMNSSLEMAQAAARPVDEATLTKSREFQKRQVDASAKTVTAPGSASVELYALSSNVRATAAQAEAADRYIEDAKKDGRLKAESRVTVANLIVAGLTKEKAAELEKSYAQNAFAASRMEDDRVLAGFGNNGGEEFLSYMQKSEALVIGGGEAFEKWNSKMNERLQKIQNQDGSWSGHHCITSPVFCTSAVVLTLAADRDTQLLRETAKLAVK